MMPFTPRITERSKQELLVRISYLGECPHCGQHNAVSILFAPIFAYYPLERRYTLIDEFEVPEDIEIMEQ